MTTDGVTVATVRGISVVFALMSGGVIATEGVVVMVEVVGDAHGLTAVTLVIVRPREGEGQTISGQISSRRVYTACSR